MAVAKANSSRYTTVLALGMVMGSSFNSRGSGLTNMMQHTVISITDRTNGGAIMAMNSRLGMLNFV